MQLSSIPFIVFEVHHDNHKSICESNGSLKLKYIGFLIITFIAAISLVWVKKIDTQGFYVLNIGDDIAPKWLNHYWIVYGNFVNVFLCFEIIYGSAFVVYSSEQVLDMVLNSVALFFIVELDNMLVTQDSYKMIYGFINSGKAKETYGDNMPKCCWSGASYWILGIFALLCLAAIYIGVIVLPIWTIICI